MIHDVLHGDSKYQLKTLFRSISSHLVHEIGASALSALFGPVGSGTQVGRVGWCWQLLQRRWDR